MTRRALVVAALGIVMTFAAGCTANHAATHPSASPSATGPSVAALKIAWTINPGTRRRPTLNDTAPSFWSSGGSLIVPLTQGVAAYSATTGAQRWKLSLPKPICNIADAPNENGVAAVLMGTGSGVDSESCGLAGAVDTRSGKLLWTKAIDHVSDYGFTDVAVGPKAVAVTNRCDAALTLSVADGSRLRRFPAHRDRGGCYNSTASDGRIVVVGQQHVRRSALVGYDAVSGRRLWSAPLHGDAAEADANPDVDRVISSDPVVVDARINSHRFLQRVDPKAGTATPFGRESNDSYPATFVHQVGPDVAVQYGQSRELFDYDATSGREIHRTVLADKETAVGLRGTDVITVEAGGSAFGSGALAVRSTDPRTGAQQVLGVAKLDGLYAYLGSGLGFNAFVVDDTLVVGSDDGVVGTTIPSRGVPATSVTDPTRYAASDIRPDKIVDLCTGVSTATRRALGFVHPTLPAPANCQFVELEADDKLVQLRISTFALAPKGKQSAVAVARRQMMQLRRADSVNHFPTASPVGGIGDEAYEARTNSRVTRYTRIITRRANVIVLVDLSDDGPHETSAGFTSLQPGARLAAKDLIATIDRRR